MSNMTPYTAADLAWMDLGHCIGYTDFTVWPVREQVRWCQGCPVLIDCLELGLRVPVLDPNETAVYGGLTPARRKQLQRKKGKR